VWNSLFSAERWVEVFGFYWTSPYQCTSTGPLFCVPSTGTNSLWSRSLRGRDAWIDIICGCRLGELPPQTTSQDHTFYLDWNWLSCPPGRSTCYFLQSARYSPAKILFARYDRYAPRQCKMCFLRNHATTLLPMIVCLRCNVSQLLLAVRAKARHPWPTAERVQEMHPSTLQPARFDMKILRYSFSFGHDLPNGWIHP
jgi:hypothetical protein